MRKGEEESLKWTYLDTVSSVDLGLAFVVLPDDTELNDTFGDLDNVKGGLVGGFCFEEVLEADGKLAQRLDKTSTRFDNSKAKTNLFEFGF